MPLSRKFMPEWPSTAATDNMECIFLLSPEACLTRCLLTQFCTGLLHFLWLFVWWPRSSESTLESPDSSCQSVAILTWMVPRSSSLWPAYSSPRWMVFFWVSGRLSQLCKCFDKLFRTQKFSCHEKLFHHSVLQSLTSTAASVSSASVPSAALVLLLVVLSAIDAPVNDVSLLFAIDWFV